MKNIFSFKLFLSAVLVIFSLNFIFCEDFENKYYKIAQNYENQNNFKEAIKYYKKVISITKNKTLKINLQLKISRINPSYIESVKDYQDFINNNPNSQFNFLALYELATLHKINNNYKEALNIFNKLTSISKGSAYWQKSLLEVSNLELINNNFLQVKKYIYKLLEEIDDYEDLGNCYFLLGILAYRQKNINESIEYFLICAGSFPQSTKASAALFELCKIYLEEKNNLKAKKISKILDKLYRDSIENKLSKKLTQNIILTDADSIQIELINLNDNSEIKKKTMNRLIEDLNLSLKSVDENKIVFDNAGFYVQLGFFSIHENALQIINMCKDRNINNAFIAKKTSNKKLFYRVIIGPFISSNEANLKLIELKEKNIEAVVVELDNNYD